MRLLLLALGCLPIGALPGLAQGPLVFPPRPRLAYTAAELAAWKADPARQDEVKSAVARADALLAKPLYVPPQPGDWIFYYACPDDGAFLQAETLERHVCPSCKKVYTDERTVASSRTQLNYQLDHNLYALAVAYALTGERTYAEPVRVAMLELARLYPTFERHDRWGRKGPRATIGGWRYAQLLDEAVAVIELAKAYDLVADAPCFTAADRTAIETNVLGFVARSTQQFQHFADPKINHRTWFNAGYAAVAVATGDEQLLRAALDDPGGLLWQLEHSVTSDGIWFEGTMAYQFYAVQAVVATLEAAGRVGLTYADNAKLKSLWLGPMRMTYPNGAFPVFNDSDPVALAGYASYYRWAYRYFHDARFAGLAGAAEVKPAPLGSTDLSGIGVAALRRGEDGANPLCAMLDYGIHGGAHGHPDKLTLVLYGLGRELVLDPGRLTYSVPEYQTWARTTAAHSTVAINGEDQREDTGRVLLFRDTPLYSAMLAQSDGAYPGYALKRFLLLTDRLLVDVFAVSGTQPARLDWFLHARGTPTVQPPLPEKTGALGDKNGYQHLLLTHQGAGAAQLPVTFTLDDAQRYRVFCLGDAASTVALGTGIGYHLTERVPVLLRRREAASAVFVTVYDLSGTDAVQKIERLTPAIAGKPAAEQDGIALRLTTADGVFRVGLDLRTRPTTAMTLQGKAFDRCVFARE